MKYKYKKYAAVVIAGAITASNTLAAAGAQAGDVKSETDNENESFVQDNVESSAGAESGGETIGDDTNNENSNESASVSLADGEYTIPVSVNYAMEGFEDYQTAKGNALIASSANLKIENGNMTLSLTAKNDGSDYVTGMGYKENKADAEYKEAELYDNDSDGNADEVVITKAYSEDYIYISLRYTSASADYECLISVDFANAQLIGGETEEPEAGNVTHTIKLGLDTQMKVDGVRTDIEDLIPDTDDKDWSIWLTVRAESYRNEAELIYDGNKYTLVFKFEDYTKESMNGEFSDFYIYNDKTNEKTPVTPVVEDLGSGKYLKTLYIPLENLNDNIYIYCTASISAEIPGYGKFESEYYTGAIVTPDVNYLVDLSEAALPEDGNYLININKDIIPEEYRFLDSYENIPVTVKDGKATIIIKTGAHLENTLNTAGAYYELYGKDTSDTRIEAVTVPVQGEKEDYVFIETSDLRKPVIFWADKNRSIDKYMQELSFDTSSLVKNEDPQIFEFTDNGNYSGEIEILNGDNDNASEFASYFKTSGVPIKSENGTMTVTLYITKEGLDSFKQSFYGEYEDLEVTPISDTGLNMVDVTLYYNDDEALVKFSENGNENDIRVRLKDNAISKIENPQMLVDGNYTVDIDLLKEATNEESMSADYFYSEAVPVEVKNGLIYMTFNIKTSSDDGSMTDLVQGFEYRKDGKWIDGKPVKVDNPSDGIAQITSTIPIESLEEDTYVRIKVSAMGSWAVLRIVPKLETLESDIPVNQISVPEITTDPSNYTGVFKNDDKVTVSIDTSETEGKIYYTLDGSIPQVGTSKTFEYTRPFVVKSSSEEANTVTVKAITYKNGSRSFTKSKDVIFLAEEKEVPVTATEPGVYSVPYSIMKAFEDGYSMANDAVDGNMIVQVSEDEKGNKKAVYYMSLKARNQNNIIGHLLQLWNIEGNEPPTGAASDYELDSQKAAVLTTVNEEGINGTYEDYPKMMSFTRNGAGEESFYVRVDVDAMGSVHQSAKIVLDWDKAEKAALPQGRYNVDYSIMKAFENDYSMANDVINGPAQVEINNDTAKYTLNVKSRNQNNIIGHLLQLWNIPGVDAPTGSAAEYELEGNKAKVVSTVNEVGIDGEERDYPSVFEFTRNSTGEDYFYVRVDVDAMGNVHQSAKLIPDWSTAKWVGDINSDEVYVEAPKITVGKKEAVNDEEVKVSISCEEGAEIYYTTDNTVPDVNSQKYTGEFTVKDKNTTVAINAVAVKDGNVSNVSSETIKFASAGSSSDETSDIEDGKYWMEINLWHANADQESMGNAAFENNRMALVTVENGVAKIEAATNPVSVSGYTSALKDIQSSETNMNILKTETFTTNTKYDGNEHTFDYVSMFSFEVSDMTKEYLDVQISVPYTPMDGISENVGGWIDARLKLNFSGMSKTDSSAQLTPDSSSASGSSGSGGGAVDTSSDATGIKIEADEFVFEDGTVFETEELKEGEKYDVTKTLLGEGYEKLRLYNIKAVYDGGEVQPNGQAKIYIPKLKDDGESIEIYRITEETENTEAGKTLIEYEVSDDGYYVITVKEFGLFAIAENNGSQEVQLTEEQITEEKAAENGLFSDISGHWAYDNIVKAVELGMFKGVTENEFAPDETATRAMVVSVLGRLAGTSINKEGETPFNDVKTDDYFKPYVLWASENNIISGVGENKFAPNMNITREQMAVMLNKFAESNGIEYKNIYSAGNFSDSDNISSWARDSVDALVRAGVISGRTDGSFDPKGTATRAEIAVMLVNFVKEYMPEKNAATQDLTEA
ncbi:MAG: NEAT domain-containing protein [Clostridia bacterium]|nr:NEAT domain-containing protein [Clostridia bacterium]